MMATALYLPHSTLPTPDDIAYVLRLHPSPAEVDAKAWDALLESQPHATPFMRHAYLAALHTSESAVPDTGWTPVFCTLWRGEALHGACAVYVKPHSYGEYVFDQGWAGTYARHGMEYYPKAVVAVPFTPVPGARLLAVDAASRQALVQALVQWCEETGLSSLHLLFTAPQDVDAAQAAGLMLRHTVQFHWKNEAPVPGNQAVSPTPSQTVADTAPDSASEADPGAPAESDSPPPQPAQPAQPAQRFESFDHFLASLSQDKRKKIRQERRRVAEAGVTFRWVRGTSITEADWDFFYRCYARTYREHGNPPYLTRDFFHRMAADMPDAWVLFIAEKDDHPIASSLIAVGASSPMAGGQKDAELVAFGRYWGALERVDCLHFEACYYQPLQWCIEHGVQRFEGGAQGEHKMARALLPVQATSAHWLAHPAFAEAVDRFLEREGEGVAQYLEELQSRNPFKAPQ